VNQESDIQAHRLTSPKTNRRWVPSCMGRCQHPSGSRATRMRPKNGHVGKESEGLRADDAQHGECWPAVDASSSVARKGSFVKRRSRRFGDAIRRKAPLNEWRRGADVFATGGGPGLVAIRSPRFAALGGASFSVSSRLGETGRAGFRRFGRSGLAGLVSWVAGAVGHVATARAS
jgi:hypothetical protein